MSVRPSVCLSVCLSDVRKHDFCKKTLSDFSETWFVHWYYGLVVQNIKVSPNRSGSCKIKQKLPFWAYSQT